MCRVRFCSGMWVVFVNILIFGVLVRWDVVFVS